jgi:PAS domain S-box-containing protein
MRGFIALTQDITERKRNEDALRAREEESRRLLAALPDVISRFDRDLHILYKSPAVEHFMGQEPESMLGKTQQEAGFPEALAVKLDECLRGVFATGQPQTVEFEYESPTLGPRHIVRRCFPETDDGGVVRSVLTIGRDVTEQKNSEIERGLLLAREHEARETAELLNEVGPLLAAELVPQRLIQAVTDIASRLIGAEFGAFFRNPTEGGPDTPGALSAAPPEAFAGFPMAGNSRLFAPTFRGESMVRSEDLLRDPGYGEGVPSLSPAPGDRPVRSYLAAPVISRSGEVLGGLFFGHGAAGRFTERHEAIVAGVAAQAAIAMDNARLFEQSRWVQNELKRANQELRRANADLETFAYSASHDLQEPLRNVAICAQLLQRSAGRRLGAEETQFLDGILQGALRMQALVQDLLSYTRATRFAEGPPPKVDAARVLGGVVESMKTLIEQNAATVDAGELPTIAIHEVHLAQLFQNLIGNALKYRSKEAPSIHVSAIRQQGWWVFSVGDNGIGIDSQYADQIFTLFKRLHTRSEYPGSGIGLAICQRIVEQYGGRIWVESSAPGEGSVFSFSIPER